MDTQASYDIVMLLFMSIICFSALGLVLLGVAYLARQGKSNTRRIKHIPKSYPLTRPKYSITNNMDSYGYDPNEVLPNGWRRKDYYDYGLTDLDIECWGMDLPGAPEPAISGFVIMDMADGDFDGEIDLWWSSEKLQKCRKP